MCGGAHYGEVEGLVFTETSPWTQLSPKAAVDEVGAGGGGGGGGG